MLPQPWRVLVFPPIIYLVTTQADSEVRRRNQKTQSFSGEKTRKPPPPGPRSPRAQGRAEAAEGRAPPGQPPPPPRSRQWYVLAFPWMGERRRGSCQRAGRWLKRLCMRTTKKNLSRDSPSLGESRAVPRPWPWPLLDSMREHACHYCFIAREPEGENVKSASKLA